MTPTSPDPGGQPPTSPAPRPRRWFPLLAGALSLLIALVAVEVTLRLRGRAVRGSDHLEPGMIRSDPDLGWTLTPGWTGRHHNHDFDVHYTIGATGFRADSPDLAGAPARPWIAVVGDSFTFGLGVDDGETFVARLNRAGDSHYRNFAVPAYSTDQEVLQLERDVLPSRPAAVLLVVYVGNDLLDNARSVPLQAGGSKPRFVLTNGTLLHHPPEARAPKGAPRDAAAGLAGAIIGDSPRYRWRAALERHLEIFRVFSQALPAPDLGAEFAGRYAPAVELFDHLLQRLSQSCRKAGVPLTVAVLAGRSFVEMPGSISAQYQDVFRKAVVATCERQGLPCVDLASAMHAAYRRGAEPWFHPYDGHLTPAGHEWVAGFLGQRAAGATGAKARTGSSQSGEMPKAGPGNGPGR